MADDARFAVGFLAGVAATLLAVILGRAVSLGRRGGGDGPT